MPQRRDCQCTPVILVGGGGTIIAGGIGNSGGGIYEGSNSICVDGTTISTIFGTGSTQVACGSHTHSIYAPLETPLFVTCACAPIFCGTSCVKAPVTCGTICVRGGVIFGNNCVTGTVSCGITCIVTPTLKATTEIISPVVCSSGVKICGDGDQCLMLGNAAIGFAPPGQSYGNLTLGSWEDYFLDLSNWGDGSAADATVFRISAHPTQGKEATLALVRGDYPNIEFLDLYNNGYCDSTNYGIRIQKRGTGSYRDFIIQHSDGVAAVQDIINVKSDGNILITPTTCTTITGTINGTGNISIGGCLITPVIKITTGAAAGCVLTSAADGTAAWCTPSSGGATCLDALNDVVIASPACNQILQYSGSIWCNCTPTNLASNMSTGQVLCYNGTTITGVTTVACASNALALCGCIPTCFAAATHCHCNLYNSTSIKACTTTTGLCICGCGYATDFVASSDLRLKKDIAPIYNAISIVDRLHGVQYKLCADHQEKCRMGMIAQDVAKVVPEVVSVGDDGLLGIDYGKLVPILVEAVHQLQKQITNMKYGI